MSRIGDLPSGVSNFGTEFNYSAWTPQTRVELVNVPWGNDYRDIVRFPNRGALDEYITDRVGSTVPPIRNLMHVKPHQPIPLSIGFNVASQFNYLRVTNPLSPIGNDFQRTYYYFVTDVEYRAAETTLFHIQLDVWSTYFDLIFPGRGYLERGHWGIANEESFEDFGLNYLTVPEGLDTGAEHVSVYSHHESVGSAKDADYGIMVWSTTGLEVDPGTVDDPNLSTAGGSRMSNLPNGASAYYWDDIATFNGWMSRNSIHPWVTQGIISITAIPKMGDYWDYPQPMRVSTSTEARPMIDGRFKPVKTDTLTNWRNNQWINGYLGRYVTLKKFLTFPYAVIEMTSYTGTPLVIRPEMWDENGSVMESPHFALPGPRLTFYPYRYGVVNEQGMAHDSSGNVTHDGGEFLDMSTGIFDYPSFSVVNNSYLSYMASNRNAIQYQHNSASWSQQKAMTGNQLSFDQSSMGIQTSQALTGIATGAATQQTNLANQTQGYRSIQSGANSVIGGALNGQAGTAVMGVANAAADYAIQTNQNTQSTNISNAAAQASNRASTNQMSYNRDTNKAYADFAARGDYANSIAAINATVQDSRMIQPTTSGQVGGEAFNLATWQWGYTVKVKMLAPNALASIGEFWFRYGYAVQRFVTPPSDFHVMDKFSYWKFQEFYIDTSVVPENVRQTVRGIFEKGVTVWRNPDDIATIDPADNQPISGVK